MKEAARHARALGLRTASGRTVTVSQIEIILKNPLHKGVIRWNGEEYPGLHVPIVTEELWERCQAVMEGKNASAAGYAKPEYVYRGLASCGVCGCAATPYRAKKTYVYYACTGARGCVRNGVREEAVTDAFAEVLQGLRIRRSVLDRLRQAIREGQSEIFRSRRTVLELLEERRKEAEERLEKLYEDNLSGEVPRAVYPKLRDRYAAELEAVEAEIRAHGPARRGTWEDSLGLLEALSNSVSRFREAKPEGKRRLFKSVVSNCQIVDGKVSIIVRPEFKLVLEANQNAGPNPALEADLENWLPAMDSNHY